MAYLLTEENIKHCTIGYLKTYYKNNSSRGFGESEAKLDMVTADGVVADGYLKFTKSEGGDAFNWNELLEDDKDLKAKPKAKPTITTFLATFEATSQDTADEIQYKVQNSLLFFDALAVAFMIAAGSYGFNYLRDQFTLNELGFVPFWAGFFGVLVASLIGYFFIFRYFPRYRYIFAIEQFNRYHADEQWIAYGEDVFEHPENKYLVELKKQCMKKGYGLISVNQQLYPTLVMTPKREEVGGARKRVKEFFSSSATITKKRFGWLKLPNWLQKRLPNVKWNRTITVPLENTGDYMRYTRSYWKQALLIGFSMLVMGEIYREELKNPNIVYLDGPEYEQTVIEQTKDNKKEPNVTFLDLETGDRKRIVDPRNTAIPTSTEFVDKVIKTPKTTIRKQPVKKSPAKEFTEKGIIISTGLNEHIAYSCNRIAHLKGTFYVVQITLAKTYDLALSNVKIYTQRGFKTNAISLSCLYKNHTGYIIYLDDIFATKAEAEERAASFHKLKVAKGEHREETIIRVINRN